MVQESLSGFHERTASMPSDDRWIQEQSFKHSRISFLNGKVRPVSWIYLWGVQRERAVDSSGLARWAPHFSGEHISHTAFTKAQSTRYDPGSAEWGRHRTCQVDPVRQSPRTMMYG